MDDISLVQGVDECSIILGVPTDTNVNLSTPTGEGRHEVEEGHLNKTRVLSDYTQAFSSSSSFPYPTEHRVNSRIWFTTETSIEKPKRCHSRESKHHRQR
jgi:hypothetical protein